jgi:hypothetical protein
LIRAVLDTLKSHRAFVESRRDQVRLAAAGDLAGAAAADQTSERIARRVVAGQFGPDVADKLFWDLETWNARGGEVA